MHNRGTQRLVLQIQLQAAHLHRASLDVRPKLPLKVTASATPTLLVFVPPLHSRMLPAHVCRLTALLPRLLRRIRFSKMNVQHFRTLRPRPQRARPRYPLPRLLRLPKLQQQQQPHPVLPQVSCLRLLSTVHLVGLLPLLVSLLERRLLCDPVSKKL